jgi:hypothetical protein
MGKGRDKQGREKKKQKKAKLPKGSPGADVGFRHHTVVTNQPDAPPRPAEQPL